MARKQFIYGNYPSYYTYRHAQGGDRCGDHDPRLATISDALVAAGHGPLEPRIRGKRCLDIGCNSGHLTICIARLLGPRWVLGVDIDQRLVHKARRFVAEAHHGSSTGAPLPVDALGAIDYHRLDAEGGAEAGHQAAAAGFPRNIRFSCENWILSRSAGGYDAVFCMSVTKWIQLNWGDEGIERLFAKAWSCLRYGGVFILEPQAFSTYARRKKLSPVHPRRARMDSLCP